MNYMEQIAKMLNVEINEEFKLKDNTNGGYFNTHFALTENGLGNMGDKIIYQNLLECILKGRYDIVKIPKAVLTDEEKEYLSYVIKPFRNRIKYFYKWACADCDVEILMVTCKDHSYSGFPPFKKNAMYKGMEPNKKYTLEDLGL